MIKKLVMLLSVPAVAVEWIAARALRQQLVHRGTRQHCTSLSTDSPRGGTRVALGAVKRPHLGFGQRVGLAVARCPGEVLLVLRRIEEEGARER